MSYLHTDFEQNGLVNTIDTFKGRYGLCLAFYAQLKPKE